jgi:hypothetical protein
MSPLEAARRVQATYDPGYAMPAAAVQLMEMHGGDMRRYYSGLALVPRGSDSEASRRLVRERVPCSIAGRDHFDRAAFAKAFGWSRPYYDRHYEAHGKLAPQLAVYCRTPCWGPYGLSRGPWRDLHVVNLIGLALDSPKQSDYRFLASLGPEAARRYALRHMRVMWGLMFEAARRAGLRRIEYARVSGGAFAEHLQALTTWTYDALLEASLLADAPPDFELLPLRGIVPDHLLKRSQEDLDGVLLVNAWDPLTLVGNGNAADHSLDGFFGRSTAMGVLAWDLTNRSLQIKAAKAVAV